MENLQIAVVKLQDIGVFKESFNGLLGDLAGEDLRLKGVLVLKEMVFHYFGVCFERLKDQIFASVE